MTRIVSRTSEGPSPNVAATPAPALTVWGLTAAELHDACWAARGVHVARRGAGEALPRGAELFLLLEPGQLVLFDLSALADRLIWRRATVTRLRIVDEEAHAYSERVVADDRGMVQRIERRYTPRTRASVRVLLSPSRRIARRWVDSLTRRGALDRIRRTVPWSRLDHCRCAGGCFDESDARQQADLMARLVAAWPRPDQGLEGLTEVATGVWAPAGAALPAGAVAVGPVWLGHGAHVEPGGCVIGPAWIGDAAPPVPDGPGSVQAVRRRPADQIEMLETPRTQRRMAGWSPGYALAKRAFDIVASATVLMAFSPLIAAVALWILFEDGWPAFYGHRRQTRGGRPFRCLKFRTMCRDADRLTEALADRNLCDGPQVMISHDPRITRVGHVLRRFQLDELPQFLNVLLGQMSVVGPRPSPDEENRYCPAWRELRLSVRPGITGLWQLKRTRAPGRDFQEWIRYDVEYVRKAGFWFDLTIIAKTAWILVRGKRASCG